MTKKKSVITICVATVLMLVILIGMTYAYWTTSKTQTGVNVIETSCFDIEFTGANDITLTHAIPISDETGMELTPYTFTVKNTCDTDASYDINLEVLDTTTLNISYVDAVLDEGSINLVSGLENRTATITGATSKNLGSDTLRGGEEKTYNLRLWMDKGVTLSADSQQKRFEAKVVITATATVLPPPPSPKCIRADVSTLHQETCNQNVTYAYCAAIVGNGNTITYGNSTTTPGVLNTGDAFDCDVDGTGYNHRFYYVSDLYTGGEEGSETFDDSIAVLMYYSNTIINGTTITPNNTTVVTYNSANKNYQGPITAIAHIPGKDQWTNLSINESRQIRNENGGTSVTDSGTTYPITFSGYTNKAARILTTQELNRGCGLTTSTMGAAGSLDTNKCRFLLENTKYANNANLYGYWLETLRTSDINNVWYVVGNYRYVNSSNALNTSDNGVRPAIEILKSDISY